MGLAAKPDDLSHAIGTIYDCAVPDGGHLLVWTDSSRTHNPNGSAIAGPRYDSRGNKVGGEVKISQFSSGDQ